MIGKWIKRGRKKHDEMAITRGCLFAFMSTVVTCLLLFINGGLVSALCDAASKSWPGIFEHYKVAQFLLFVGPVLLVILEWMMIDYVMSRLRRHP